MHVTEHTAQLKLFRLKRHSESELALPVAIEELQSQLIIKFVTNTIHVVDVKVVLYVLFRTHL